VFIHGGVGHGGPVTTEGPAAAAPSPDVSTAAASPRAAPPAGSSPRRVTAAVTGFLALLAVVVAVLATGTPNDARWTLLLLVGLSWLAFGIATWTVLQTPVRLAVPLVLGGAVILQLAAIAFPPRSTDDFYRYVWDGRVQAAGIDPYRYIPVDPALARFRDPWLFPPECRAAEPPCTRMNHPTDPTIYPPVAQGAFLAVHVVSAPWHPGPRPLQLVAAALAILTAAALIRVLRRSPRGDPRTAVLWAWCPTVVLECGNNAHIDVLASLLVVLALGAAVAGRRTAAGLAIGAAVSTKILPLLVLPALLAPLPDAVTDAGAWRRWARRGSAVVVAFVAVVLLGYLPHVLAVGGRVAGFLPAYLDEEGYEGGSRFALLGLLLPGSVVTAAGLAVLAAVALGTAWRADPARPWTPAMATVGAAFTVTSVPYPWYALLLVPLVALDGRWEWLAVAAAAYPVYFTRALDLPLAPTRQVSYGLALALVAAVSVIRARTSRRSERSGPAGRASWSSITAVT
jgi:hypothetical protein